MSNLKTVILALLPLVLIALIIQQVRLCIAEFHRGVPQYQLTYEAVQESVETVERAVNVNYQPIDTTFSIESTTLFAQLYRVQRRASVQRIQFQRPVITLQGVIQGENPMAVLIDASGASHFLTVGETLLERKLISISNDGVTLRDPLGSELISVQ